jgi:hypothetical protein
LSSTSEYEPPNKPLNILLKTCLFEIISKRNYFFLSSLIFLKNN